jgi:predicted RNA-binding Zn ribbon-like protein
MTEEPHEPWARRMLFISGRLSLDFAHSGGEGRFATFERLREPDDLVRWLALSPLHLTNVAACATDLADARTLRSAVWDAANVVRLGISPRSSDVATLNRFAAAPPPMPVLAQDGCTAAWVLPSGPSSAFSAIARDAIDLFAHQPEVRIKQCENPTCPLLFIDTSRAQRRRWCSMERCGNMTKVARHRSKADGASTRQERTATP